MKMASSPSKIVAIQFGEAALNMIRPDVVPIRAKLALLAEDGSACGSFEKSNSWSEKTLAALQALADSIEEDALGHVFQVSDDKPAEEKAEEPAQF